MTNHSIPFAYEFTKEFWNKLSTIFRLYRKICNIRKYDAVIAVSPLAAEYIRLYYPQGNIHIIPPPVDEEFFHCEGTKEELGFDEDDKIVLFVGRMSLKKGLRFAIQAFKFVADSEPKAKLCIVGPLDRMPRMIASFLTGPIESWGLLDRIIFTGKVSREVLKKFYAASDVFIFPSQGGESFGIVLLEAMAAGKPIVTTHGGALGTYIRKYRLGFVTGADITKFAASIVALLRNPDIVASMGERARRFARIFSWDEAFRRIDSIYREVMYG